MSTNHEYDNARTGMALALCVQTSDGNVTFALSPVLLGISRRNFNPDFLKGWSLLQTTHHCQILLQRFSISFLGEKQCIFARNERQDRVIHTRDGQFQANYSASVFLNWKKFQKTTDELILSRNHDFRAQIPFLKVVVAKSYTIALRGGETLEQVLKPWPIRSLNSK